jgi:hypothetical protein
MPLSFISHRKSKKEQMIQKLNFISHIAAQIALALRKTALLNFAFALTSELPHPKFLPKKRPRANEN